MTSLSAVKPKVASGDREARDQTFEIPFKRSRQRLVEVVDVDTSRRSGAANAPKFDRCASPHSCTFRPVLGERARSAAITTRRRGRTQTARRASAVADRHELRHPRSGLLLQQPKRIARRRRGPLAVRAARTAHVRPCRTPRAPPATDDRSGLPWRTRVRPESIPRRVARRGLLVRSKVSFALRRGSVSRSDRCSENGLEVVLHATIVHPRIDAKASACWHRLCRRTRAPHRRG